MSVQSKEDKLMKVNKLTLKYISNYFDKFGDKASEVYDHIYVTNTINGRSKFIIGRTGVIMIRNFCQANDINFNDEMKRLEKSIFSA